jgi:hypothetical protein
MQALVLDYARIYALVFVPFMAFGVLQSSGPKLTSIAIFLLRHLFWVMLKDSIWSLLV